MSSSGGSEDSGGDTEPAAKVHWSDLPCELLGNISSCLRTLRDYVAFRAVCRSWRALSPPQDLPPLLPWLLFPPLDDGLGDFFSPFEQVSYTLHLAETRGQFCLGSSHGWLFLVGRTPELILFNPITRAQIQLPPLTSLPDVLEFRPSLPGHEYLVREPKTQDTLSVGPMVLLDEFISSCTLSSHPTLGGDCIVAMRMFYSKLGVCRVGGDAWTDIGLYDRLGDIMDVMFYNGRLFALGRNGRVVACEVSGPSPDVILLEVVQVMHNPMGLVEWDGRLMVLTAHRMGFRVYSLDFGDGVKVSEVEELDDTMLFHGYFQTVSASASAFPGQEGSCVYFCDCRTVISAFKLKDGSIKRLPSQMGRHEELLDEPTIWFTPSLC